ncbi:MAG: hypothetical protein DRP74_05260 [Candidatus Omnitrophota bacterium]|nr:MAG: hypothetical protein DRP74_05260 [Candidatus Omnitrophota bacterium]
MKYKKITVLSALTYFIMLVFSTTAEVSEISDKRALFTKDKEATLIAALVSHEVAPYKEALKGFQEVMSAKGSSYEVIVYQDVPLAEEKRAALAEELKAIKPDLVLSVGTEATKLAAQRIKGVPIIFSMALISNVMSLRGTNNNLTGASINIPVEDQLEELSNILPEVKKVGLICDSDYYNKYVANQVELLLKETGIELITRFVKDESEVFKALDSILSEIDIFLYMPDQVIFSDKTMKFIMSESAKRKVPLIAPSPRFIEEGALIALGCDYRDIGRQSAELALEAIEGKPVSQIPISQARSTHLYLNLRAAKSINLDISPEAISHADKIIE